MRKAFTIIEVVATLILLSVVFVTIPAIFSASVKGDEATLEGEALYHATALINHIANPNNDFEQMLEYNNHEDKGIDDAKRKLGFTLKADVTEVSGNSDALKITVTAKHKNSKEIIGTLSYTAYKIEVTK